MQNTTPNRRKWILSYALGMLFGIGFIAAGVFVWKKWGYDWWFVTTIGSVKLKTPVGDDYFSVQTGQADEVFGAYVIPLTVGTAAGKTHVYCLLDTGSSDTWFRSGQAFITQSPTFVSSSTSYQITYLGGSASGYLAFDHININTYEWSQNLGVITASDSDLSSITGLMGMSRGGCDSRELCSLTHWPLKSSLFGFYYDSSIWEGLFMAGYVDENTYCADGEKLHYINQEGNYFWTSSEVSLYMNGGLVSSGLNVIFDTGTTYMYLKQSLYNKVMSLNNPGGACSHPNLEIVLNGKSFPIPETVLVKNGNCALRIDAFQANTNIKEDVLIGAVFLINYYTVFDIGSDRIGFCTPKIGAGRARRLRDGFPSKSPEELVSNLLDHGIKDPYNKHSNF